ncbi:MAG: hypothetical protein NVS4B7_02020 [Ktedonobacteraceae bacterium]
MSTPALTEVHSSSAQYALPGRTSSGMYAVPSPDAPLQAPRTSNLGFIIGGLCVIAGGLLLVFVYFMALSLPLAGTNTTGTNISTSVSTAQILPSPTVATHTPTVVASLTVGVSPGQQYIVNPQMTSSVNTSTAQPLQATSTFKVNQTIYVTFNIHPNGNNGAVCLIWYLNNRSVTQFPFAVTASASAGYSYATYRSTGVGYVEIFWASSIACTDKVLAQQVNFTVTK